MKGFIELFDYPVERQNVMLRVFNLGIGEPQGVIGIAVAAGHALRNIAHARARH